MNNNKELNDNLERLFSTIKDAYGIASMINAIKEKEVAVKGLRDYEILTFAEKDWNEIEHYKKDGNGFFRNSLDDKGWFLEGELLKKYPIRSVKRLSDNSVWTVGRETTYGVIESFSIEGNWGINVHFTNGSGATLHSIGKVKEREVLFVSEDGKNIFSGDLVFVVTEDWKSFSTVVSKTVFEEYKYFSTEDKAKKYKYHNQPCLSYNDAVHWLASDGSAYGLYEIVKEKINNQ